MLSLLLVGNLNKPETQGMTVDQESGLVWVGVEAPAFPLSVFSPIGSSGFNPRFRPKERIPMKRKIC